MIAEALKKALLQAAIQGKLTEQLPEDGDAKDLLKEIQNEKARLIKEGKIKKEKPLPEIKEDEIPFDIPENWVWARLGDVTNYGIGRQVKPIDIPINSWILELEDIDKNAFNINSKRLDRKAGSNKNYFSINDVLYGKLRPYLKKVIVAEEEGYCSTEIIPFNGYGFIHSKYLMYFIVSPSTDGYINNITHGMDMPRLGTDKARQLLLPIPPFSEQKRVIEKLEELLPEIETLKEEEKKLDTLEKVFPGKVRASILQAAIQGKLTEQLPEDGDAKDLLKELQKEKARLIKEGNIKKAKPLPEITENEIPFDIPENWVWARLGDCNEMMTGNSIPKDIKVKKYSTPGGGLPYIGTKDVSANYEIDYKNGVYIPLNEPGFKTANKNSTLLCVEGGSAGRKIAMTDREVCFGNKLCKFEAFKINSKYVFYYLQTNEFGQLFKGEMTGIIGGVGIDRLKRIPICLPPLAEQERIVQELDDLLPLCAELR